MPEDPDTGMADISSWNLYLDKAKVVRFYPCHYPTFLLPCDSFIATRTRPHLLILVPATPFHTQFKLGISLSQHHRFHTFGAMGVVFSLYSKSFYLPARDKLYKTWKRNGTVIFPMRMQMAIIQALYWKLQIFGLVFTPHLS